MLLANGRQELADGQIVHPTRQLRNLGLRLRSDRIVE
jgi:hypothetical protein